MANFFKSVWFRCITVLLSIILVSGGLIAILSDVLYVSPAERTARAMTKLYGVAKEISDENVIFDMDKSEDGKPLSSTYGTINKIYIVGDKTADTFDMVYQTSGKDGYKGGTITLWLKVIVKNFDYQNAKIDKVVLESYDKQTLMSKFDAMYFDQFVSLYESGKFFTASKKDTDKTQNVVTGATKSSIASCNAVNCVIEHLKTYQGGAL